MFLASSLKLTPSVHPFISFCPCISAYAAGDIPDNVYVPPIDAQVLPRDGFYASNSVDSEPYEITRVVDSDDDHPIREMTKSDVVMLSISFLAAVILEFMSSAILLLILDMHTEK